MGAERSIPLYEVLNLQRNMWTDGITLLSTTQKVRLGWVLLVALFLDHGHLIRATLALRNLQNIAYLGTFENFHRATAVLMSTDTIHNCLHKGDLRDKKTLLNQH